MNCTEKIQAYLREQNVPFQVQHHTTAYTAQQVAATEHVSGKLIAKPVMVFADDKMVMLVMPANRRVDFHKAAALLRAERVRLAEESEFAAAFPDCDVGAMPPFGQLYGLPMYVDAALTRDETIIFSAGTHTKTMSVKYADYERLGQPVVADFTHT
ncbi:MAG: aminoacyl-tRNA deacylase [Chloroflexota bacterium]